MTKKVTVEEALQMNRVAQDMVFTKNRNIGVSN